MFSAMLMWGKRRDFLEHVADVAAQIERIPLASWPAADENAAGIGHEEAVDELEDGALAGAAAADERDGFAALQREVHRPSGLAGRLVPR